MFVWFAAAGEGGISGFSKNDFINYYAVFILVNQLTYPVAHWTVGDNIFNGTFSFWLIRPVPVIFEAIAADLSVKIICFPFVCVFMAVMVIILKIKIVFTCSSVLLFLVCLMLSQILRFLVGYALSLIAMFTRKIQALLDINNTLVLIFAGQIIPTILLPDVMKRVSFYLPYRYMIGFPVEVILGKLSAAEFYRGICISMIWILVLLVIYKFIWLNGIKRYTSVGG